MKKLANTTIRDVAAAADVSVGTASMALSGKGNVNPQTKKKVLQIADKLEYKPNRYAKALSSNQTNNLGLMITDITNPFFGLVVDYIQQELETFGYDLMLGISNGSADKEKKIISKFTDLHVDGVIAVPSHKPISDTDHIADMQKRDIPICFITTYYNNINAPCVMTDLSVGSYWLTKHLLQNGHKTIVYIVADLTMPLAALRVDGYRTSILESGGVYDPNLVETIDEPSFEGGFRAAERVIKRVKPDAILAMNDIMALGVLKYLKENGYKVPDDISLAGYDDLIYTSLLEMPLTTVSQPIKQMCAKAVEIIIRQIENKNNFCEKIFLPPELIIRDSTRSQKH